MAFQLAAQGRIQGSVKTGAQDQVQFESSRVSQANFNTLIDNDVGLFRKKRMITITIII